MAEASKGGWVRRAARSSASTRPCAWFSRTVSASSGSRPAVTRARASATESSAMASAAVDAGAAAGLLDQPDAGELDVTVDRLHHVVEGEASDGHRCQRFHLDSGLGVDLGGRFDTEPGGLPRRRELDGDLGERQRMT